MRYLKVILTIITILLTLHLIKPFFISTAHSYNLQDVNIVAIGGSPISPLKYSTIGPTLPVRIID